MPLPRFSGSSSLPQNVFNEQTEETDSTVIPQADKDPAEQGGRTALEMQRECICPDFLERAIFCLFLW